MGARLCVSVPFEQQTTMSPQYLLSLLLALPLPGAAIDEVRTRGESCGGEVTCVVRGCPKGLGTPVFDKLEAELAKAIMSLPATKVRLGRCTWEGCAVRAVYAMPCYV